jgi:hypothetical protein
MVRRKDQTAVRAKLFLLQYAMKPRPAKPTIIIAQVEGFGHTLRELDVKSTEPAAN